MKRLNHIFHFILLLLLLTALTGSAFADLSEKDILKPLNYSGETSQSTSTSVTGSEAGKVSGIRRDGSSGSDKLINIAHGEVDFLSSKNSAFIIADTGNETKKKTVNVAVSNSKTMSIISSTNTSGDTRKGIQFFRDSSCKYHWEDVELSGFGDSGVNAQGFYIPKAGDSGATTIAPNCSWVIPGDEYVLVCNIEAAYNATSKNVLVAIYTGNKEKDNKVEQYGMIMCGYPGSLQHDGSSMSFAALDSSEGVSLKINVKIYANSSDEDKKITYCGVSEAEGKPVFTGFFGGNKIPWTFMEIKDVDAGQWYRSESKGFVNTYDPSTNEGIIYEPNEDNPSKDVFDDIISVAYNFESTTPYTVTVTREGRTYSYTVKATASYYDVHLTSFFNRQIIKDSNTETEINTIFAQRWKADNHTGDITSGKANFIYQIGQSAGNLAEGSNKDRGETIIFGFTSSAESNISMYTKKYTVTYDMCNDTTVTPKNNPGLVMGANYWYYGSSSASRLQYTAYAGTTITPVTFKNTDKNGVETNCVFKYWTADKKVSYADGGLNFSFDAGDPIPEEELSKILLSSDVTFTAHFAYKQNYYNIKLVCLPYSQNTTTANDPSAKTQTFEYSAADKTFLLGQGYKYNSTSGWYEKTLEYTLPLSNVAEYEAKYITTTNGSASTDVSKTEKSITASARKILACSGKAFPLQAKLNCFSLYGNYIR